MKETADNSDLEGSMTKTSSAVMYTVLDAQDYPPCKATVDKLGLYILNLQV